MARERWARAGAAAAPSFGIASALVVLLLGAGCERTYQHDQLSQRQDGVEAATRRLEAATDDPARAAALSDRGRALCEKARYGRAFDLIDRAEGERLMALATADHDRAVTLQPRSADVHLARGLTHETHARIASIVDQVRFDLAEPERRKLSEAAEEDFTQTLEIDPRRAEALDHRGLERGSRGDRDSAIQDFTRLRKVDDRLGRLRLAEEYCQRGATHQQARRFEAAAADYEQSIALQVDGDGCDCQPDGGLAVSYTELKQFDQAWQTVTQARANARFMPPEVVEQLAKASGRSQ